MNAHQQVKNGSVLKFLKDYWFIVLFIVGAAISWSEVRGSVLHNSAHIERVQASVVVNASEMSKLELQYVEDVTFIKTKLIELSN